jgi:hypothetical protein
MCVYDEYFLFVREVEGGYLKVELDSMYNIC